MTARKNRLATSALVRRRLTAGVSGGGGGGPTAPSAFTAGMWSISNLNTGGDARITITSLPSNGGSAITALQYQKDAGSWTNLGGTGTGNYDLLDVFTDGVQASVKVRAVNAVGNGADSDTKQVTTTAPDVTAPTLSSPTDAANGSTAATGSVSTNEGNGTLYWVVSTSSTAPSAAQVKAGQMHTSRDAEASGSQAVSGTGVQTLSPAPSGLTASTAYWIHFMHEDAATNQSAVASGDGFTTTAAGGITGHDTVVRVTSSATASSYSFTLAGVTSGQLIHLPVKIMCDSNIQTPASWTVTLNGVAATFIIGSASGASGTFPAQGTFRVIANASGDLPLSITLSGSARACAVDARYLNGVHATTPVVGTPAAPSSLNADVTSLDSPNGYVPQAAGNVILDDICIKGGDITGLSASGADGSSVGETGSNATSDVEIGAAYIVTTNTSAKTIAWSWTGADRVSSTVVEYQPA